MEKNLNSGKLVHSPEKPGHENITQDVHKKIEEGIVHAPSKEGEKLLKYITNNGMITDHVKWAKICVNKEESTHDHNVVNDEELISIQSSEKSTATNGIIHLTCCKKFDHQKLDKRFKKTQKLCAP